MSSPTDSVWAPSYIGIVKLRKALRMGGERKWAIAECTKLWFSQAAERWRQQVPS